MEGNMIFGSNQPVQQVTPKKGSKGRKGTLIVLVLIAIVLAVTNPTINDFEYYIAKGVAYESDSVLIKGLVDFLGKTYIEATTRRDNYVIFSTYTVVDGEDSAKFLGFLNNIFIRL